MVRLCVYSPLTPAHVPLFLYPFLNTTSKTRPFEYLRLTSLGVIGALVKVSRPLLYGVTPAEQVAKRQLGRHKFPPLHRDHPSLLADHGNRQRALQNSRYLYRAKDPSGRSWPAIHLSNVRTILCCWGGVGQYGPSARGQPGCEVVEACGEVLFTDER